MDLSKTARWVASKGCEGPSGKIRTAVFTLRFVYGGGDAVIALSASSRYKLEVNGARAAAGPCKGDRWRHFYDEVDIGPFLKKGENVLRARVVAFPPTEATTDADKGPDWSMARAVGPCLYVSGACGGVDVTTGAANWRAAHDESVGWKSSQLTLWLGGLEIVDASKAPKGDGDAVIPLFPGEAAHCAMYGVVPVFPLLPRPIPMPEETKGRFAAEMPRREDAFAPIGLLKERRAVIPANTLAAVELDAGELVTAYIRTQMSGGAGTRVVTRYAECYSRRENGKWIKGRRDDTRAFELIGHEDVFVTDGGERAYEPFSFRTFRFVRLEIQTAGEPLAISLPEFAHTGYPLGIHSSISCPEKWVGDVYDLSARTLARCMHETYEDCPYYEQLQYTADTRLQMLFTYRASGDTRMALRAIEDYHASLLPCGLTQSRYPCQVPQVIPPFSLHFIHMVLEYFIQTGDRDVLRRYRPTVDAILDYYDRKIGALGLVENVGYWDFIDWVDAWGRAAGRCDASLTGSSATHNLMYVSALQAAADIFRRTDRPGVANEYERRAARVLSAVKAYHWSPEKKMLREGVTGDEFTQHAQVYAVLTGFARGDGAKRLMKRALSDPSLAGCSFAWQYFVFRALEMCGAYGETWDQWAMWRDLIPDHLTTIPEIPGGGTRSDCHAWGALALYEFPACVLGVRPAEPGWEAIEVRPHPLRLTSASGTAVTPKGPVSVAWTAEGDKLSVSVRAPEGVPVTIVYPDGTREIV